jgi:hypothetical protein
MKANKISKNAIFWSLLSLKAVYKQKANPPLSQRQGLLKKIATKNPKAYLFNDSVEI